MKFFEFLHKGNRTETIETPRLHPVECPVKAINIDEIEKDFEIPKNEFKAITWEGQKEAREKLRKKLAIKSDRFNIAIIGPEGIAKRRTVLELIEEFRTLEKPPEDLIALQNFEKRDELFVCFVPQAYGKKLNIALQEFIKNLEAMVPAIPERVEATIAPLRAAAEKKYNEYADELEKKAYDAGLYIVPRNINTNSFDATQYFTDKTKDIKELRMGGMHVQADHRYIAYKTKNREGKEFYVFPDQLDMFVGQRILSFKEKGEIERTIDPVFNWSYDTLTALEQDGEKKSKEITQQINTQTVEEAFEPVSKVIQNISEQLACNTETGMSLKIFSDGLKKTILENIQLFNKNEDPQAQSYPRMQMPPQQSAVLKLKTELIQKMRANILIDSSNTRRKPFVEEDEPTWENLFGRIDRHFMNGTWISGLEDVKPGSIFTAHGGFLMLNIRDIFTKGRPYEAQDVWKKLVNVLTTGRIELEQYDPAYANPIKLKIPAIPIKVRVILEISLEDYLFLAEHDPNFIDAFKVAVEFNTQVERSKDSFYQLAAFAKKVTDEEKLNPLDPSGITELARYASRMAGTRNKYSLNFGRLADVLREAHSLSKNLITANDIQEVIRDHNSSLIKDYMLEVRKKGIVLIRTANEAIGQINALAVFRLGKASFGIPYRITVNTEPGDGLMEITDIENKAGMAGQIYKKGFAILTSLFKNRFSESAMKFNAEIAFDQSYSGVDGDSASLAIYCALISDLSGIPIKQIYAVTGRISQKGEVGPIGGVNEKIEGFYRVCKEQGLTGTQGVIIPATNVADLILEREVTEAIKKGLFHVYPVSTAEEALEILTGMKAGKKVISKQISLTGETSYEEWENGTIYGVVQQKLRDLKLK